MDVIAILTGQRRAVERLYDEAAGVFAARKKKIEAAEEPYQSPPFNPDYDDPEPPFLEEWHSADLGNTVGNNWREEEQKSRRKWRPL